MRISTAAFAVVASALAGAIGITAALCREGGLINTTQSYPRGLYLPLGRTPRVGDFVALCPTGAFAKFGLERGYLNPGRCPSGSVPLIKRLVAGAGDQVVIGPAGVTVDGRALKNSRPLDLDRRGRPLPHLRVSMTLAGNQVLLMSDYAASSFDGRYFGPFDGAEAVRAVRPVLTVP